MTAANRLQQRYPPEVALLFADLEADLILAKKVDALAFGHSVKLAYAGFVTSVVIGEALLNNLKSTSLEVLPPEGEKVADRYGKSVWIARERNHREQTRVPVHVDPNHWNNRRHRFPCQFFTGSGSTIRQT